MFTFTFVHVADAFILRDLHSIVLYICFRVCAISWDRTYYLGIDSAMLYRLSNRKPWKLIKEDSSDWLDTMMMHTFLILSVTWTTTSPVAQRKNILEFKGTSMENSPLKSQEVVINWKHLPPSAHIRSWPLKCLRLHQNCHLISV